VRAVLGLGRGLGLPVLAEGVETAGELEFLSSELCSEAQGYLLGLPAGIEEFRYLTHGSIEREPQVHAPASASKERLRVVGK
jgi:diguanylate cyclase